jgi:hypothetical protein
VFAWGLLVTWAATGRHPFGAPARPSPRPRPDLAGLPPRLALPVRAALAADPAARPSARDLLLCLCGSAPPPAGPTVPWPPHGRRRRPPPTLHDPLVRAPRRRRGRRGGLPAAVLLIALAMLGGWLVTVRHGPAGDISAAGPSAAAPPAPPPSPPPPSPTTVRPAAGAVRDGGLEFAVTGRRCGVAELGEWPTRRRAKGTYCVLDLRVTNVARHDALVFMNSQRLVDADGREFPGDEWAWVYNPGSRVFTSTFEPGRTVNGSLVFDVPPGTRVRRLIVHDTPLSAGTSIALS